MPHYDLEDRAAIVTGAGRGIGRAVAARLAAEGASVVVSDIDEGAAIGVADEIGAVAAIAADVSKRSEVDGLVTKAAEAMGRLDIFVDSAGILSLKAALDVTEEDWDRHMAVNGKGVLFCAQAAARQMLDQGSGGRIIVVVSTAGRLPSSGEAPATAYVASKHAAMGVVRQMGLELAPHGILMNAVFPGIVDTEMLQAMQRDIAAGGDETYDDVRARFEALIPLGAYQAPEDVAGLVAFLASSDATQSVGQAFDANGGIAFW